MTRPTQPIMTEWETTLMRILWERDGATSQDVRRALRDMGIHRSDSAIRKTLRAMEAKDLVRHETEGRSFVYRPRLGREQAESKGIQYLSRLFFQGSPGELALRAIGESELTPELVGKLRRILDEAESR